jgi:hypothetical protein
VVCDLFVIMKLHKDRIMKMKICGLVVLLLTLCGWASLSLANPIVPPSLYQPDYTQFLAVPFLLVMEGIILATLAGKTRPYFFRFVGAWTLLTTITFILLMIMIELAGESRAIVCILGEIAVTVTEGIALYYLLRFNKLTKSPDLAPSFGISLLYSLVANTFSFIGGVLVSDIPGKIHDLMNYLSW